MKTIIGWIAVLIVALCFAAWGDEYICSEKAAAMDMRYKYSITTECMIEVEGQFVPLRNYRKI